MNAMQESPDDEGTGRRRLFNRTAGIGVVLVILLALVAVYNKEQIITILRPTETITAVFDRPYKLTPYRDDVKLAGVVVGTVAGEEYNRQTRTSLVTLEVNPGVREKLGTEPSAHIRPTLLLGGNYYVDLVPGGGEGAFEGDQIPPERTTIPVELDRVLQALNSDARAGAQASIGQFGATLQQGGKDALRALLADAPATLQPAGKVLDALRGEHPGDLTAVVTGFESTAEAFTQTEGRVARIIESFNETARAFAASSPELAEATRTSVQTQQITQAGLKDLQPTLRKLAETAPEFQPSAQALDPLFEELDPVLEETRVLVNDLRPLLEDLRPAVEDLVPAVDQTTEAFDDLSGPVLDRVNGPILDTVLSDYQGKAPFENAGANGNVLYKEVGYLVSHLLHTFSTFDRNGGFARLTAGFPSSTSFGGTTPSGEQFAEMFGFQQPPGPQGGDPLLLPFADQPGYPNPAFPPSDAERPIPRNPAEPPSQNQNAPSGGPPPVEPPDGPALPGLLGGGE